MEKRKIYLCGQISGMSMKSAKVKFDAAQKYFTEMGMICCNPCRQFSLESWEDNLIRDLMIIKRCDAVCLLDGWDNSGESRIEKIFSERICKEILYFDGKEITTSFKNYVKS